ncbi:MAG: ATP-dependent Clp protease adaptor ClpS [Flavobacteriaceae bacterium]|nr:ATP-dependent Clp protease adaptor ClpS [Flavobacteriaceae bacterium]
MKSNRKEKYQESIDTLDLEVDERQIVLFNDDVNTFDFVIDALIDVCEHDLLQAEQCTLLVHYKGKATVKTGPLEDLKPRATRLLEMGLSAELV